MAADVRQQLLNLAFTRALAAGEVTSLRQYAEYLQMSSGYLSQALNGSRGISGRTARRIAAKLDLSPREESRFLQREKRHVMPIFRSLQHHELAKFLGCGLSWGQKIFFFGGVGFDRKPSSQGVSVHIESGRIVPFSVPMQPRYSLVSGQLQGSLVLLWGGQKQFGRTLLTQQNYLQDGVVLDLRTREVLSEINAVDRWPTTRVHNQTVTSLGHEAFIWTSCLQATKKAEFGGIYESRSAKVLPINHKDCPILLGHDAAVDTSKKRVVVSGEARDGRFYVCSWSKLKDTWKTHAILPKDCRRVRHQSFVEGHFLIIWGGQRRNWHATTPDGFYRQSTEVRDILVINLTTGKWQRISHDLLSLADGRSPAIWCHHHLLIACENRNVLIRWDRPSGRFLGTSLVEDSHGSDAFTSRHEFVFLQAKKRFFLSGGRDIDFNICNDVWEVFVESTTVA